MQWHSRFASRFALAGFEKIGDVLCPGDQGFPSYSKANAIIHIDRVLETVPDDDRTSLLFLVSILSFAPKFVLRGLMLFLSKNYQAQGLPGDIRYALSGLHFGIRGMIFSTYYGQFPDSQGASMDINNEVKWQTERSEHLFASPGMVLSDRSPVEVMALAKKSQSEVENLSLKDRLKLVANLRLALLASREKVIARIQEETKKSKTDALLAEVFSVLDTLKYFEDTAEKQLADRKVRTPLTLMGKKSLVAFDPMGVVLVISPWNYPVYQAIIPSVLAFICGNAVVYKPSEFTPLKGLFEELLYTAGFDPSWIQVIYGDGNTGRELIENRPDKIFFTGSVATGKKIMAEASKYLIPVELELGGKDPMIVFEDATISRAVRGALWGGLTNCGQACTSVERIYVQESIYPQFRDELLKQMKDLRQGVDADGSADFGLMTTATQAQIVTKHIENAKATGATVTSFAGATVIENAKANSLAITDETFGPTLPLIPFSTEAEAITLANRSDFGLSASVWSKDQKRAFRVSRRLQVGNVSVNNVMLTEGNPALPFGGVKQSGFGRFKGEFGYYAFTNIKAILVDKDSKKIESNWYPYTKEKYQLFDKLTEALFSSGGVTNFLKFVVNGLKLEMISQKNRTEK